MFLMCLPSCQVCLFIHPNEIGKSWLNVGVNRTHYKIIVKVVVLVVSTKRAAKAQACPDIRLPVSLQRVGPPRKPGASQQRRERASRVLPAVER